MLPNNFSALLYLHWSDILILAWNDIKSLQPGKL